MCSEALDPFFIGFKWGLREAETQTLSSVHVINPLSEEAKTEMLFVTLMQPKGRGDEAIKYLKALRAPKGITLKDVYFTFGRYDGVIVFEAANEAEAMKFVMQTGFATHYTMETLIAVPAKEI